MNEFGTPAQAAKYTPLNFDSLSQHLQYSGMPSLGGKAASVMNTIAAGEVDTERALRDSFESVIAAHRYKACQQ